MADYFSEKELPVGYIMLVKKLADGTEWATAVKEDAHEGTILESFRHLKQFTGAVHQIDKGE